MGETFLVGDVNDRHVRGDKECPECWSGWPMQCTACGTGLKHAAFGDEMEDGYWLSYRCDKCDDTREPAI